MFMFLPSACMCLRVLIFSRKDECMPCNFESSSFLSREYFDREVVFFVCVSACKKTFNISFTKHAFNCLSFFPPDGSNFSSKDECMKLELYFVLSSAFLIDLIWFHFEHLLSFAGILW